MSKKTYGISKILKREVNQNPLKFFDAIYCIDDILEEERSKSNSWRDQMIENKEMMFYKILDNIKYHNEVSIVGDTVYDMIAGNKAGITTIGVLTGYARKEELSRYANLVLSSIKELQKVQFNFVGAVSK